MMDSPSKCTFCSDDLGAFRYCPMPQWNVSGLLCGKCYDKKLIDHYIASDRREITKR